MTREELIELCEKAIVPVDKWGNRDTPEAQEGVGHAWALLKAGCDFEILRNDEDECCTNEDVIWFNITAPSFGIELDVHYFYLPTAKKLAESQGGDWY